MVASCALRCAILLAGLCRFGAGLLYSGDPGAEVVAGRHMVNRSDEEGFFPWETDKDGCAHPGWQELRKHGSIRTEYMGMIERMQGRRFLFAGDSLMDMVIYPLWCSAKTLGWQVSEIPVGSFGGRADYTSGGTAKMFTKENHSPIVMAFMRFYNYKVGDGNVKLDDVFHFPITPNNFDVVFMNMAHNAMFSQDWKVNQQLVNQLMSRAHAATNVGRVVFLGHPPQHFKTETGSYDSPEMGDCMCHDKAALEKQPIFRHNQCVEIEVNKDNARSGADGKCAFANPWSYYADKCRNHGHLSKDGAHAWNVGKTDCTHWFEDDLHTHTEFLKYLVATAGL